MNIRANAFTIRLQPAGATVTLLGLLLAGCNSPKPPVFDFTRLNADGSVYRGTGDYAKQPWACVRDNQTTLVWEVKTAKPGLQYEKNTYTWYNPDENTNGGDAGKRDGGSCTGSRCDTESYKAAVNAKRLCGFSDWRLPQRMEVATIIDGSIFYPGPTIEIKYFPNTPAGSYWAETPFGSHESGAWTWRFDYGYDYVAQKIEPLHVRLVRGTANIKK